MDVFNGITIEKYAELCALMADTAGDEAKEFAIAKEHGVTADDWKAAKEGFTKKMMDPTDMGKTALAFMPLFQEAQSKVRGGGEPCTLEMYTKVHAEMAFKKDPADATKQIDFMAVIAENGFTHAKWLECETYWTPVVMNDTSKPELNSRFNPEAGAKFAKLMQEESDRILGMQR